jgi:hypothetical protein
MPLGHWNWFSARRGTLQQGVDSMPWLEPEKEDFALENRLSNVPPSTEKRHSWPSPPDCELTRDFSFPEMLFEDDRKRFWNTFLSFGSRTIDIS